MSLSSRLLPLAFAWALLWSGLAAADTTTTTSTTVTTMTSTSVTTTTSTSTTVVTTTTSTTSTTLATTTTTSTTVTTSTSTSSSTTTSTSTSSSTTTSTSTTSTTSTSIQVCQCDDLPFFAEFTAKLAPDSTVSADLGVNESNGIAVLATGATMEVGTTLFADRVRMSAGANVYNVRANDLQAPPGGIGGTVGPVALPLRAPFCPLPALSCGTGDLLVSGTSVELPAGDYGDITVAVGATLRLVENGTYRFCELRIANGGTLLATHQVTIEVVGNVIVGTNSGLRTSGRSPLVLRVGGSKVLLGRDALVTAAVTAPNAKAKVKNNSRLEGCICAEILKVAKQGSLACTGDSPSGAFID